nr:polyphenol oxidase I, chloroplastic-like [Ipomoea batatas]
MVIPSVFTTNPNSSLYNENRNQSHLPPTVVDLSYDGTDTPATDQDRISNNLFLLYKNMVSNAGTAEMFLGKPYRGGYIVFKELEGVLHSIGCNSGTIVASRTRDIVKKLIKTRKWRLDFTANGKVLECGVSISLDEHDALTGAIHHQLPSRPCWSSMSERYLISRGVGSAGATSSGFCLVTVKAKDG